MSGRITVFLVLMMGLILLQCSKSPVATERAGVRELTAAEKLLVESDNRFGFKLFKQIVREKKDENVFISPLSVSMALGMTYNGAAGETREVMQKTLELSGMTLEEVNKSYRTLIELLSQLDPKVKFQIANSIWCREEIEFKQEFIDLNKEYFDALVTGLDFSSTGAADVINRWVDENTNGKIKQIVKPPISPYTIMFLINAIYFKGLWTYQFEKDLTEDADFHLLDGSKRSCQLMTQEGQFQYFENSTFQAIDLPYGDEDFSMVVFLPRQQTNIDTLTVEFDQENWSRWVNSFSKRKGSIQLPRFTLQFGLKLNDALKALGMSIAFDPSGADFTNLYEGPVNAYISEVMHKSFVEVNEEGTEAAAATSVTVGVTSVEPAGFWMRVDRPFIFAIRENRSQTILFMGKIVEPTSG